MRMWCGKDVMEISAMERFIMAHQSQFEVWFFFTCFLLCVYLNRSSFAVHSLMFIPTIEVRSLLREYVIAALCCPNKGLTLKNIFCVQTPRLAKRMSFLVITLLT